MQARCNWFNIYAAAILENDQEKITDRIAVARKAIEDRILQLEAGESAGDREPRDLADALNKLQILVSVMCASQSSYSSPSHPSTSGNHSLGQAGGAL